MGVANSRAAGQPSAPARRNQHGPSLLGMAQQQQGTRSEKGGGVAHAEVPPNGSRAASPELSPRLIMRTGNRQPSPPPGPRGALAASAGHAWQLAGGNPSDTHGRADAAGPDTVDALSDARTASSCSSSSSSQPAADADASAGTDMLGAMEASATNGVLSVKSVHGVCACDMPEACVLVTLPTALYLHTR